MFRAAGSDCCGTCEFNEIILRPSRAVSDHDRVFLCQVRHLEIDSPFWTACYNHQRRNPLLVERPRGPLWATIRGPLRPLPLPERLEAVPELHPPRDLAGQTRVPYLQKIRPLDSDTGDCLVCGSELERTIALGTGEQRLCFCSVAHYMTWWLEHAPAAEAFRQRQRVPSATVLDNLAELDRELAGLAGHPPATRDLVYLDDVLTGLEGAIIQAGHGFADLALLKHQLEQSEEDGPRPKHLQQILLLLAHVGQELQADLPDRAKLAALIQEIHETLHAFLQGDPYPSRPVRRTKWWQFWRR